MMFVQVLTKNKSVWFSLRNGDLQSFVQICNEKIKQYGEDMFWEEIQSIYPRTTTPYMSFHTKKDRIKRRKHICYTRRNEKETSTKFLCFWENNKYRKKKQLIRVVFLFLFSKTLFFYYNIAIKIIIGGI